VKFEDRAPEVVEEVAVANAKGGERAEKLDLLPFAPEVHAAVKAAGEEETAQAIEAVTLGKASPEALLAWMDDLRYHNFNNKPTLRERDPKEEEGYQLDFIADSKHAGGAVDTPMPPAPEANAGTPPGGDDMIDYFFSATRRKNLAEDGELPDPDASEPAATGPAIEAPKKT